MKPQPKDHGNQSQTLLSTDNKKIHNRDCFCVSFFCICERYFYVQGRRFFIFEPLKILPTFFIGVPPFEH